MSSNNSKTRKNERRQTAIQAFEKQVKQHVEMIPRAQQGQKKTRNHESEQIWYEREEQAKLKLKLAQRDLAATKQKLANS